MPEMIMTMSTRNIAFFWEVYFLLSLIQNAEALQCFQCSTFDTDECKDIPPRKFLFDCGKNSLYCYTFVHSAEGMTTNITRRCGTYETCEQYMTEFREIHNESSESKETCLDCQKDTCNSASTFDVPLVLMLAIFLIRTNYLV